MNYLLTLFYSRFNIRSRAYKDQGNRSGSFDNQPPTVPMIALIILYPLI